MTQTKTTRTQHDSPKKNRFLGLVLGRKSVHQEQGVRSDQSRVARYFFWARVCDRASTRIHQTIHGWPVHRRIWSSGEFWVFKVKCVLFSKWSFFSKIADFCDRMLQQRTYISKVDPDHLRTKTYVRFASTNAIGAYRHP
jgi:hypothetical protein